MIAVGSILRPVGLRGEVKVSLLTDFPERFKDLSDVIVETKGGEAQRYRIDHVRYALPFVYVTFAGLSSIEQVSGLAGGLIQIPEEDRVPLPEGNYYHFELEGLDAYLEDGAYLGKVEQIFKTGSNDVFVVRNGEREYLIPALHTVVKEIDLSKKRMVIVPVEGLLE